MTHYSKANEFDTISFNGKSYDIKFYQGYLFATEQLAADVYDEQTGLAVSEEADKIDQRISFYFDEDDFYGKSGKELYDYYDNN